ncbi:MAG: hypothetical protein CMN87_12165 [Stappia sp.]|uniref:hypothetical protein n=1 Tax=Stappia sp. TaxID=1870903 RepID=UPI000C5E0414|nr:hypothetical protein [Stappia sp.]MBM20756.1 hypothetical protein [Stappia sp.]
MAMMAKQEAAMCEDQRRAKLAAVREARERVEVQGDPLGILRRPAANETRHATGHASAGVRKARDPLLRAGGTLKRLSLGPKAVLGKRDLDTARCLAWLWETEAGGGLVRAIDWTLERVDGGRGPVAPDLICGASDAHGWLLKVRLEVGARVFRVLHRIIAEGESVTAIAMDLEEDAGARASGGCSRRTRDHVSRMLRDGLEDAGRVLGPVRGLPALLG